MPPIVRLKGLRELEIAASLTSKKTRSGLNRKLRDLAEPIKADAEGLALSTIPRIGPAWWHMRVGITRKLVYVAPRQRGVKTGGSDPRRRPKFADLMAERVMDPALERNAETVKRGAETFLDEVAAGWNRKG